MVSRQAAAVLIPLFLAGCAGRAPQACPSHFQTREGAICRGPDSAKRLALVFTGHDFAEGGGAILDALRARRISAAFFLTGDFLRREEFAPLVRRMVREGHYVGPHSDKHLLYCSWDNARTTLVSRKAFDSDLDANLAEIRKAGFRARSKYFLPPYEHNNLEIAAWTREAGLQLVNYTEGSRSAADYTGEGDRNFVSSTAILESIKRCDQISASGLNGFILLLHLGAGPGRADKMHHRLPELLDYLARRGYQCPRLDKMLKQQRNLIFQ